MLSKIIFRVDANPEVGTGHLMRCMALANAAAAVGLSTCFFGFIEDEILINRLRALGHKVSSLDRAGNLGRLLPEDVNPLDWVVLDGYEFQSTDHRAIRDLGCRLLIIDDMANLDIYDADIILNQNFSHASYKYRVVSNAKLLMGPAYSLLRNEFIDYSREQVSRGNKNLLITLGGGAEKRVMLKVLEALKLVKDFELDIFLVGGSSNLHWNKALENIDILNKYTGHKINAARYIENMAALMAWADFAIIGGGTTTLEVAYMGLPSLVITLADNQKDTAIAMAKAEAGVSLGWYETLTAEKIALEISNFAKDKSLRKKISVGSMRLVDGQGAAKVVNEMMMFL